MSETQDHVTRWRANVFLFEEKREAVAQAVLETGATAVHGSGRAVRASGDADIEVIGDELAAGRALIELGRSLLGAGEADIEAITGEAAHVNE
jgi:hypothetical protein